MSNARRLLPPVQMLQAFEAVARLGSFTEAARELALTQSAVSRQVRALEDQLGVPLLLRDSRNVALTSAGAGYARTVRTALDDLRRGALQAMGAGGETALTLAILPTFGTRWLMPRLPGFLRRHPEITLRFATRIGPFDMLRDGVDAAIHAGRADWPGARATLLFEEVLRPVAAPGMLEGAPPDPARIVAQPLLALASRPGDWLGWLRAHGVVQTPRPALEFEHFATLARACAAGLGVGLLPTVLIGPEVARGELVALGADWSGGGGYWFVEPDLPRSPPATQRFRDWLLDEVQRSDGAFA